MSSRAGKFVSMLVCLLMTFKVSDSVPVYTDLLMDPEDIPTLVTAASFLADYGFISPDKGNSPPDQMNVTEMTIAVKKMQKYAAVDQTGRLDQATLKMMKTARCGCHDEPEEIMDTRIESTDSPGEGNQRQKRYAVAGLKFTWDKTDLTYKITNYPDNSQSRITPAQVRQDTEKAFQLWSDVTPLSFTKVEGNENADIHIYFGAFYHTDIVRDPLFDGLGGTLAHAFFPKSGWGDADGDVHLDDSEIFTHQEIAEGTDYLYTVTHEIGHALGMAHASERSSLMFPYDKGYIPDLKLPQDDVQGIQLLYGRNPRSPDEANTAPAELPICSLSITSLTMVKKILYVFSGNKFWKLSMSKNVIGPEEGTLTKNYFHNAKDGSSAVYTRWDGKTVFFRGRNYWIYDGTTKEQRTPLKIAALGVPKAPSAVMHDSNERHTYFFKWAKVWKYDERTQSIVDGFPQAAHKIFLGLPTKSKVQAAFIDKSGARYLLVGREYYRFTNGHELDPGYPKDFLVDYFDCQPQ